MIELFYIRNVLHASLQSHWVGFGFERDQGGCTLWLGRVEIVCDWFSREPVGPAEATPAQ